MLSSAHLIGEETQQAHRLFGIERTQHRNPPHGGNRDERSFDGVPMDVRNDSRRGWVDLPPSTGLKNSFNYVRQVRRPRVQTCPSRRFPDLDIKCGEDDPSRARGWLEW
jgi:hypothetical protein